MVGMGMGMKKKQAKVMKVSDDRRLDQAVLLWFKQKRFEGVPILSGSLCERRQLSSARLCKVKKRALRLI